MVTTSYPAADVVAARPATASRSRDASRALQRVEHRRRGRRHLRGAAHSALRLARHDARHVGAGRLCAPSCWPGWTSIRNNTFAPGAAARHRRPAERGADDDVRAGGARVSRRRSAAPASARPWRSAASATSWRSMSGTTRSMRGCAWLFRIVGGVDGAGVRLAGRHPAPRPAQFSGRRRSLGAFTEWCGGPRRVRHGICATASVRNQLLAMRSLAPVFQLAVSRPRHLQADQRQHAAERPIDEVIRHVALREHAAASGRSPVPAASTASDRARRASGSFLRGGQPLRDPFRILLQCRDRFCGNGVKRPELPAA